jgi:cystathionine beta-lyase/cystathionine gamma-synthase
MAVAATIAPAPAAQEELLPDALDDLRAGFDELLVLVRDAEATLAAAADDLETADVRAPTLELLLAQILAARSRNGATGRRVLALKEPAGWDLAELEAERARLADLLRTERSIVAALATAADWQSPSFVNAGPPAAGRQHGRIRPHWNDYKRDRHLAADAYGDAYVAQIVDGPDDLRGLLTSCGMAALTTLLALLRDEGRLARPVVVGRGLYHETRLLLERELPGRVHVVDERDTAALTHAIDLLAPGAVFLDSLSNTMWMPVPDLAAVSDHLRGRDTTLVVDNTGLSVACQPFALAGEGVRLLAFESLLKYAQHGLDRANGGIIVARARDAEALADYREHLGTNIPDFAVHALPHPERRALTRRLERLGRNAAILAERLLDSVGDVVDVVYPGLAGHPCHAVARGYPFQGGCLALVLRTRDPELYAEHALVQAVVAEAAHRDLRLIGGSSFGFDTTRVYLTAARAEHGEPFVRIAAGTEHRLAVERIAEAIAAAVCSGATRCGGGPRPGAPAEALATPWPSRA